MQHPSVDLLERRTRTAYNLPREMTTGEMAPFSNMYQLSTVRASTREARADLVIVAPGTGACIAVHGAERWRARFGDRGLHVDEMIAPYETVYVCVIPANDPAFQYVGPEVASEYNKLSNNPSGVIACRQALLAVLMWVLYGHRLHAWDRLGAMYLQRLAQWLGNAELVYDANRVLPMHV